MSDLQYFFQHGSATQINIVLGVLSVAALATLWYAYRSMHLVMTIRDTPTSLIRSAAQGYVELTGYAKLMPGMPIYAPLSGRPCVWYQFSIEERQTSSNSNGHSTHWKTVRQAVSEELFLLVDTTGECVIDPDHAEVFCSTRDRWRGDTPQPQAGPESASRGYLGKGQYRYNEQRILENDPLYAIGLYATEGSTAEQGELSEDIRQILIEWKNDPRRMRQFDTNQDGHINLEEWEGARAAARSEALQSRSKRTSVAINLMRKPLDRRRPYVLSVKPPEDLMKSYYLKAGGATLIFLISSSVAIWGISLQI